MAKCYFLIYVKTDEKGLYRYLIKKMLVKDSAKVARQLLTCITLLSIFFIALACNKEEAPQQNEGLIKPIEWDQNTRRRVSDPNANCGYPRIIQLKDRSLIAVMSRDDGSTIRRSYDLGDTWVEENYFLPGTSTHSMYNAEITQLDDGSILVSVSMWAKQDDAAPDTTRRWHLAVTKSSDLGKTWSPLKIIHTAGWHSSQGVWEPRILQLPSGELQLFFSDNQPYGRPNLPYHDQNISMYSSTDGGETWTSTPRIISHRVGFRDGMAAPIVLKNKKEIVCPIEDNGYFFIFKISILRTSVDNPWPTTIGGNSPFREYAMESLFPSGVGPYAGGPYIAQLHTGQTVLYSMSNFRRSQQRNNYVPLVAVGDENARNFKFWSQPFEDVPTEHAMGWGSITTLDNGEIIVVADGRGYSAYGNSEIWMVKGKLKK
jgi:hypothetical protein